MRGLTEEEAIELCRLTDPNDAECFFGDKRHPVQCSLIRRGLVMYGPFYEHPTDPNMVQCELLVTTLGRIALAAHAAVTAGQVKL